MKKRLRSVMGLLVLALICVALVACQAGKKSVTDLSLGQSGTFYYQVPTGIDLTDIIKGKKSSKENDTIKGRLFLPEGETGEKRPAVVIMHASGGVFSWREVMMAKEFNKVNIAAFIPYSFASRGVYNSKKTAGTGISFGMRMADAYEALRLLATHPQIDSKRIGIMGYSSGGIISMLSNDTKIQKVFSAKEDLAFAAHLNVYTSALFTFASPSPTQTPMLFLAGEKDFLCPIDKIKMYMDKMESARATVDLISYPGAYHVFDSPSSVKSLRNYPNDSKCSFFIQDNGVLKSEKTGVEFRERDWADHIAPCSSKGVKFGRNSHAEKQYVIDTVEFFKRVLH